MIAVSCFGDVAFLFFTSESHIAPLTHQTLHVMFGSFGKFQLVTAHLFFFDNMLSNLAQTFSGVFIT